MSSNGSVFAASCPLCSSQPADTPCRHFARSCASFTLCPLLCSHLLPGSIFLLIFMTWLCKCHCKEACFSALYWAESPFLVKALFLPDHSTKPKWELSAPAVPFIRPFNLPKARSVPNSFLSLQNLLWCLTYQLALTKYWTETSVHPTRVTMNKSSIWATW